MGTYKVRIEEKLVYDLIIRGAASQEQAEDMAFNHKKFTGNLPDSNDSEIVFMEEVEEEGA